MGKKTRKKAKAKKSKKTKKARRPRKSVRAKTRRSKRPAKAGSAFQLMIETINEAERLRAKNERRDVTDETG
jgi:hypothetical protein